MEIQKHYIDANGNHFVATFDEAEKASKYTPPKGAKQVPVRPSPNHVWRNAKWVEVAPEE